MRKGRPTRSQIRQNMVELLDVVKQGYGYDIYKKYLEVFPKVTLRSIYYHLKKGVQLGEFKVHKIEKERGDYSWGPEAEKIYYTLGDKAEPRGDERVKSHFSKK